MNVFLAIKPNSIMQQRNHKNAVPEMNPKGVMIYDYVFTPRVPATGQLRKIMSLRGTR